MELFLKITATLLLLVFTFHPVLVQETTVTPAVPETTDTPRRTIAKEWLRDKLLPKPSDPEANESPGSGDQVEQSGAESGNDLSGTASGSMYYSDSENVNDTMEYTTQPPTVLNETTLASENQGTNSSASAELETSDKNITSVNTDNSTTISENTDKVAQNSTNGSNSTTVQTTTAVPERETTTSGVILSSSTEYKETTTTGVVKPETTTQETIWQESTTSVTPPPEETTTPILESTTAAPVTPDEANLSDKGAAGSGETAERGFASDSEKRRRKSAWGAVLGTFVAIAVVGLVAYVILKKKHHKAFSHRKLQEEFPSDPVLRLDNNEPLDLNFGKAAYYNPTLQVDNIQMSPFPRH
ncbi:hypothetical protein NL108_014172 [Boleophthalmus pectinirostris]|uniref:mucin-15 n=1 Tax=Boleophthalmus pectinirostris TaxID=150288 RepID=UPI000A1C3600|nr:mucin-15 [Boleophthalmus pectinirostris]KAJ0056739.1 hypothetical protein NL108_014172 [Boleophthalmus pectinirostris]